MPMWESSRLSPAVCASVFGSLQRGYVTVPVHPEVSEIETMFRQLAHAIDSYYEAIGSDSELFLERANPLR